MKRKIAGLLALTAVLSLLLTGCGRRGVEGNPLPEGMDEETVLDAGRQVVELLNDGDYQEIYDQMSSDGQKATSVVSIQDYMDGLFEKVGAYEEENQAMATGQKIKDTGEEYATAVFLCKHTKKDVMYRIAFSADMELMGLEVTKK